MQGLFHMVIFSCTYVSVGFFVPDLKHQIQYYFITVFTFAPFCFKAIKKKFKERSKMILLY